MAVGSHSQALMLRDPFRIIAVLYWCPPTAVEMVSGPDDGDPVVADAGYILVAAHDPKDQLMISDESDGAVAPTGAEWPAKLLSDAARAYFEKWGEPPS